MAMSGSEKNLNPDIVYEGRMAIYGDLLENRPKRENFTNDEEYKSALIDEYLKGREIEYQLCVQNEAMKAYNISYYTNKKYNRRKENTSAWAGYPTTTTELKLDSCYNTTPEIAKITNKGITKGNSCAISATSFTYSLSEKMGYSGKENIIIPKSRVINNTISLDNNCFAANCIHRMDSISGKYTQSIPSLNKKNGKNINTKITLSSAIENGMIDIGDEFSIKTGKANIEKGTTGCHAMFVVDIKRDSNGKVISYTLGGNNPPTLEVVTKENFKTHRYGSKSVVSIVNTNKWIKDKDKEKVSKMSIQELEELVVSQKDNLKSVIEDLKKTEECYINIKGYKSYKLWGYSYGYREYYEKNTKEFEEILKKYNTKETEIEVKDPVVVEENDNKDIKHMYSKDERVDIEETMEKQAIKAEDKLKNNEKSIEDGTYGKDEQKIGEAVDKRIKEEIVKESIPQTKEKTIDKIKTKEYIKKETKMYQWFANRNIKLDTKLVDKMIEKYGIDIAYDLALKSMMEPTKLMANTDGKWRNSRKSICYFIEEDVSDEKIAKITGRSLDEVKSLKPTKENNEKVTKEPKDTEINVNVLPVISKQR